MRNLFYSVLIILLPGSSFTQSGYLGNRNAVEFEINIGPSNKRVYVADADKIKSQPRYIYSDFGLGVSRTVSRHIELYAGYSVSALRPEGGTFYEYHTLTSGQLYLKEYRLFDNTRAINHSLKFEFKLYRKGNISPLGRYIGLGFIHGSTKIKEGTEIYYGGYGDIVENERLIRKYDLMEKRVFVTPEEINAKTNIVTMFFGQNYPLSKKNCSFCSVKHSFYLLWW